MSFEKHTLSFLPTKTTTIYFSANSWLELIYMHLLQEWRDFGSSLVPSKFYWHKFCVGEWVLLRRADSRFHSLHERLEGGMKAVEEGGRASNPRGWTAAATVRVCRKKHGGYGLNVAVAQHVQSLRPDSVTVLLHQPFSLQPRWVFRVRQIRRGNSKAKPYAQYVYENFEKCLSIDE